MHSPTYCDRRIVFNGIFFTQSKYGCPNGSLYAQTAELAEYNVPWHLITKTRGSIGNFFAHHDDESACGSRLVSRHHN